jgi:hypothetical protein
MFRGVATKGCNAVLMIGGSNDIGREKQLSSSQDERYAVCCIW